MSSRSDALRSRMRHREWRDSSRLRDLGNDKFGAPHADREPLRRMAGFGELGSISERKRRALLTAPAITEFELAKQEPSTHDIHDRASAMRRYADQAMVPGELLFCAKRHRSVSGGL